MNKKKIVLILSLFIIAIFIVLITPFVIVTKWHLQMTDFKEGIVEEYDSFDGHYTIRLSVEKDDYMKLHYANVALLDCITGEEIFSINNEYRAWDFHWVVWENESYNFWLKSGDVGTFCYEFQSDNKTWLKYAVVKMGKEYYELQEGIGGTKKKVDIEEVKKRLPEMIDQ